MDMSSAAAERVEDAATGPGAGLRLGDRPDVPADLALLGAPLAVALREIFLWPLALACAFVWTLKVPETATAADPAIAAPPIASVAGQVPRGLARRVGAAATGSSGQGWRG